MNQPKRVQFLAPVLTNREQAIVSNTDSKLLNACILLKIITLYALSAPVLTNMPNMNTIVKYGMAAMMALTVNVGAFAQLIDTEENADSSTSAEALMAKPVFHGHGFRCFIGDKYEWGAESWDFSRSTVFAVAGSQVNPYLFVGAGAGYAVGMCRIVSACPCLLICA